MPSPADCESAVEYGPQADPSFGSSCPWTLWPAAPGVGRLALLSRDARCAERQIGARRQGTQQRRFVWDRAGLPALLSTAVAAFAFGAGTPQTPPLPLCDANWYRGQRGRRFKRCTGPTAAANRAGACATSAARPRRAPRAQQGQGPWRNVACNARSSHKQALGSWRQGAGSLGLLTRT